MGKDPYRKETRNHPRRPLRDGNHEGKVNVKQRSANLSIFLL
jgi:hypothetical protein